VKVALLNIPVRGRNAQPMQIGMLAGYVPRRSHYFLQVLNYV